MATRCRAPKDTGLDLRLLNDAGYFRTVHASTWPSLETGLDTADIRVLLYQMQVG